MSTTAASAPASHTEVHAHPHPHNHTHHAEHGALLDLPDRYIQLTVKIYVGHLSATTTVETVKHAFSNIGIHVNHVKYQKARSFNKKVKDAVNSVVEAVTGKEKDTGAEDQARGYAFVWVHTEADAHKAVEKLNNTQLDGHPIKVEIATEKPAATAAAAKPKAKKETTTTTAAATGAVGAEGTAAKEHKKKTRKPKTKKNGVEGVGMHDSTHTHKETAEKQVHHVHPHHERTPRGPPTGEPSTTQLFVANLPFNVDDAALKSLFEGFGAKVERAEVKHSRFGRKASKGYGFVTFPDTTNQQLALNKATGHQIGTRVLTVKVAIQGEHAHGAQTPVVA